MYDLEWIHPSNDEIEKIKHVGSRLCNNEPTIATKNKQIYL